MNSEEMGMDHVKVGVPGLLYLPDYITAEEEISLLAAIDCQPWLTDLKRRVQQYGYRYDYKKRAVDREMYLGLLPGWIMPLAERIHADGLIAEIPDQAIINEYAPGQGIASHVDCIPCFGDTILSLSLGTPCVMIFTEIRTERDVPILLASRSLVVMRGASRSLWKHGIMPRKMDVFRGKPFERGRRVSVTFRKVIV
jgi:alkylated DNA repair dioxygenase AlkB